MNNTHDAPRAGVGHESDADRELGLVGEIVASFQGRQRWLMVAAWAEMFVFLSLTIFATTRFFDAEGLRAHVGWATLAAVAFTSMVAVKIWYHNRLNRNAVVREVRRLKGQIAQLRSEMPRT